MDHSQKTKNQLTEELESLRLSNSCLIYLLTCDFESLARVAALERVEAEHERAEKSLQGYEERFRKIFDYSNDAIFLIDPAQDEILDVNSTASQMLGFSRDELLSMNISSDY